MIPLAPNLEEQGREVAEQFRNQHGLGTAPLGDLVALIELTQNIDVSILSTGPDSHGMTVRDPDRGVAMIAAARTRNPMRQRSTLAHELAHILFEDHTTPKAEGWGESAPEETRANNFARHLLVPESALAQQSARLSPHHAPRLSALSALVQHFLASPQVIAIQLANLGIISNTEKQEWMNGPSAPALAGMFGWSDHYRALQEESNARRAPQRLLTRAIDGYRRGLVSIAYIARLRNLDVAEVEAEFAEQGIYPDLDRPVEFDPRKFAPPTLAFPAVDLAELQALGLTDELPADD